MRLVYGVTGAVLLGGAAWTLSTGLPAGAQVAQNDPAKIQTILQRSSAPESFAHLVQKLQPAVVNISTRQHVRIQSANPFAGTPFADMFGDQSQGEGPQTREA